MLESVPAPEEYQLAIGGAAETMSIEDLPPEVLVRIFSNYMRTEGPKKFLWNIQLVCQRWKKLSATPSLWDEITLKSLNYNFDHLLKMGEKSLLSSTRCLSLNNENVSYNPSCPKMMVPADIVKVARYCFNLRKITISNCEVSVTAMKYLARKCPDIDQLIMDSVKDTSFDYGHLFLPNFQMMVSPRLLDPLFSVWAPKLQYLSLRSNKFSHDDELISKVADRCHALKFLSILNNSVCDKEFRFQCPIAELMRGCPKLQVVQLACCDFVFQGDEDFAGFKELRRFIASGCDFRSLDLSLLLRNSIKLEVLGVDGSYEEMRSIPEIPSEKLSLLGIGYKGGPMDHLVRAVGRWRYTLKSLIISSPYRHDLMSVLEALLEDNPEPVLKTLFLDGYVMPMPFLKNLVRVCRNLSFLELGGEEEDHASIKFQSRKEVKEILDLDKPYYRWREEEYVCGNVISFLTALGFDSSFAILRGRKISTFRICCMVLLSVLVCFHYKLFFDVG